MSDNLNIKPNGAALAAAVMAQLTKDGWRESPNAGPSHSRMLYKRFSTPTRCRLNDDRPGIQVCITVSSHDKYWSYELDLAGELHDGTWIRLHNWILPPLIDDGLALIHRLLQTWEFMAAQHPKP